MAIQRAFALLTVSATQRHPAYSHVPQRLARPWHFSKTIKNRLKWEKMISHFKRLRFSNFAAGYIDTVASLILSLFILKSGYAVTKEAILNLE